MNELWMTADERYIFDERLAILGCMGQPTPEQFQLAFDDVLRFRYAQEPKENHE
jgi:hypothetical protein